MIVSFGPEGCRMTNTEIVEEFGSTNNVVRRAINNLQSGGELTITGNKGRSRRIYPARAPGISQAQKMKGRGVRVKKRCGTCGEWKNQSEFYRNVSKNDGLAGACKACSIKATIKSRRLRAIREKINK